MKNIIGDRKREAERYVPKSLTMDMRSCSERERDDRIL